MEAAGAAAETVAGQEGSPCCGLSSKASMLLWRYIQQGR